MRITDIIWKDCYVEKMAYKHALSIREVEEVLLSEAVVRRIEKGHVQGEHVYSAMSRIGNGRYLIVFFLMKGRGVALPISARDMTRSERDYYGRVN